MTTFIQLHMLTFHAPSNLNRDDTGRPKTALVGGVERLRISSQALKRAIRTSDLFKDKMGDYCSERTRRLGDDIVEALMVGGIEESAAKTAAIEVAAQFGKSEDAKSDHPTWIRQLAFISPSEKETAISVAKRLAGGEKINFKKEPVLAKTDTAVDIAMFGRMLADSPEFNREAAVQVAHAITTHSIIMEDDFYTAVDDLNDGQEDGGAGFIGNLGFSSGVFYNYTCINRDLLIENLTGDEELAMRAVHAFVEAAAKVSPSGKQNSFASHASASYILAERGDYQPRSLAAAFLKPVEDTTDLMEASVENLRTFYGKLSAAYDASEKEEMDVHEGTGTLAEILAFVATH